MTQSKQVLRAKAKTLIAAQREMIDSLIEMRKRQGISQHVVAERMGVSQSAVSQFEHYDANPTLSTIRRYALAVDANVTFEVTSFEQEHNEFKPDIGN